MREKETERKRKRDGDVKKGKESFNNRNFNFGCCIKETVAKYYRALNSILRADGRSNDMTMLRLIEAQCIPILSYGIEIVHVRERDKWRKMRVA